MKRKDFLTKALLVGGALTIGSSCGRRIVSEINGDTQSLSATNSEECVLEPQRKISILAKADVVVVGGGPSGVAAAISAARAGANTYLVERYNHLGGLWTGGLVLPLLSTHAVNKDGKTIKVIHGIGGEVSERLRKMDMTIKEINPTIDAEAAKYVLDEMIAEAGVKMVYHALGTQVIMDGNTIKGVFIESKSGRQALLGKVVIDCTGDGDIFHFAGEKYDEMLYHIGLVHRLGNTDRINTKATGYKEMGVGEPTPIKGVNWVNMHGEDEQCAT
ncbi:MAG: FAD-dependent oxidoreductase, partial [Rikenellaceae bacterium]